MADTSNSRRRFIRIATVGAIGATALGKISIAPAAEKLKEDDPQAKGLGYKHDASEVDTASYPRYEEGQVCANCQLYNGEDGSEWGACSIFQNRLVAASGWCNAWVGS